jgi:hypothetical protein
MYTGIQNLFANTGTSVPAVTMLRSSVSMYVFFVHNKFFLIACFGDSSLEVTFRIALVHMYTTLANVCKLILNLCIR